MTNQVLFETERLIIRNWRETDKAPFAKLSADPTIREFFPDLLSQQRAYELVDEDREIVAKNKYGWCAAELKETGEFIGMFGLTTFSDILPFYAPGLFELGWYLATDHWGKGLATEGGQGALDYAWQTFGSHEVVAFTATINLPSRRVMQRLGMTHDPSEDFDHPKVDIGHRLRPHVLYRIQNPNKKGR